MSTDYKQFLFEKDLELDFPAVDEKQSNEIPLELRHRTEKVLSILKEAIEKFQISLVLPKILENPKVVQAYLRDTQYSQGLELVREYRKRSKSQAHPGLKPDHNGALKIIDYFQENYKILNVLPNWTADNERRETNFLHALKDVCKIAEERFARSATTDLAKEKRLHVFYLANESAVGNLRKIKHQIQQKQINLRWKHVARSGVIQKVEEEMAFKQHDNHLFVNREMSKSRREIQRANNAFVAKQQELEEDLKKARSHYEAKLKKNLSQEKSVQDERNKIQLQLQALIKKYDQTVYDKHVEEMRLQEEHDRQKQEFEEFLEEYRNEEAIYDELVIKQQRLQEAKALMFTYTRAAIKIQKWWKARQKRMAKERAKQKMRYKAAKEAKSAKQAKENSIPGTGRKN